MMKPSVLAKSLVASGFTVLAAATAPAHAAPASSPPPGVDEQVRQAAVKWLENYAQQRRWRDPHVSATVTPNSRPAPACDQPYEIAAVEPTRPDRLRFTVRCPGDTRVVYRLATGAVHAQVLVATASSDARSPLDAASIGFAERDLAQIPDALTDRAELSGKISRHGIKLGHVLRTRDLQAENLVHRNQNVRIVARNSAIEISTAGIALQDGARGDAIRVRNASANAVITARVTDADTVEPIIAQ